MSACSLASVGRACKFSCPHRSDLKADCSCPNLKRMAHSCQHVIRGSTHSAIGPHQQRLFMLLQFGAWHCGRGIALVVCSCSIRIVGIKHHYLQTISANHLCKAHACRQGHLVAAEADHEHMCLLMLLCSWSSVRQQLRSVAMISSGQTSACELNLKRQTRSVHE